ncbi:MAG TPA: D-aminoacylase, partial [Thermoanaerobaculia bacterium]|nr:D-aminoacylase [Thermoanaerobaculia bacterium]
MKTSILALAAPLLLLNLAPADPPYDLLLTRGRVVDGSSAPWFVADVGVRDGRIVAVGTLAGHAARRTVDVAGMYVTPGFIDLLGQSEYNVLVDKRAASKITQGITTEVTGEGVSIAPLNAAILAENKEVYERYGYTPDFTTLDGYFRTFERRGSAINLATFVGAGTVRDFVIGQADRRATPEELQRMCDIVDQAMRDGAVGVSSSLQYVPDMYNSTDELIAMAKVAARYGGAYFTHQRSEANAIDSSLDEVIRIAKETPIRTQIWHLKTAYKKNWGRMPAVLERLQAARAEGIDVAANQYPYTAGSNGLDACLPPWIREGGHDALLKRLADPAQRERAKTEMLQDSDAWSNQYLGSGGPDGVLIASVVNTSLK